MYIILFFYHCKLLQIGKSHAQPNAVAISFPCMIPWPVVELSWEELVTIGSKNWALLVVMRDEAALQLDAASNSAGGCRKLSSPEPKAEHSGLISKTCHLPKFQGRILGSTFWDLYKVLLSRRKALALRGFSPGFPASSGEIQSKSQWCWTPTVKGEPSKIVA